MADFENNNMNTSNAQNGAQGGAAGNDPYAYQNGYYRNTTPHQDEAVHSGAGTAGNTAASGAAPQKENNGYTYVNYYSDPNGRKPGDPDKKPKKKHTGLKVAAFVLSMVLVSGASIGVYEGVRSYNSENGTSIVAEQSSSADSKGSSKNRTAPLRTTSPAAAVIPVKAGFSWPLPTAPCLWQISSRR